MKKWILIVAGIIVLAVVGFMVFGRGLIGPATPATAAPAANNPAPVQANSAVMSDGVVVPAHSARLTMSTGGIVAETLVAEGDQVTAGQPLVRLQSERQQAAVAQAEATLRRAQEGLAQAKAGPRTQEVAAAQAAVEAAQAGLARIQQGARPEDVAAAEAAVASAQASLQKAKEGAREETIAAAEADVANADAAVRVAQAAYDQIKGMAQAGMMPQSLQLEQATNAQTAAKARLNALLKGASVADVAAASAQVQQARAQLEGVKAGARPAEIAAAEAEIKRAQAQLELLQAGARPEVIGAAEADVAAAEAALRQAKAALAETELTAPFAGTVATLSAKVGEQVASGAPVAVLADLGQWEIETEDLTEINVVRIKVGDPVVITFDAIPDLELPGKVVGINAVGEKKMGDMTYTVTVAPDQADPRLLWNMTATVEIGDN